MTGLLIFAIVLAIISFTVFFRKLDELMGLIDSIENNLNKIMDNGKCEKENTR